VVIFSYVPQPFQRKLKHLLDVLGLHSAFLGATPELRQNFLEKDFFFILNVVERSTHLAQ
jgi:hypothetical protein